MRSWLKVASGRARSNASRGASTGGVPGVAATTDAPHTNEGITTPEEAALKRPIVDKEAVVRLWLERQGLALPRGSLRLTRRALTDHLERTGALQVDSVNAVERAHRLTLWSRFGAYEPACVDDWVYRDRIAYEYWGHEASILPISHLPLGRRRMRRFPPKQWRERAWWPHYRTSAGSKRRVLRRLRTEGPLESAHFERRDAETDGTETPFGTMGLPKEDGRSLKLLWHDGRVAISSRRHFRCVYDIAENVYPAGDPASLNDYRDSWLLIGLSGNGIASERHLTKYMTAPALTAAERKQVIARSVKRGRVVEVGVRGSRGPWYVLPEHLERLDQAPEPAGTTLICPFDSLLWQRRRALDLLDFDYRIEIYVPMSKRQFGYYVMPILHRGKLVGRLDPKLHRDRGELEIKGVWLEPGVRRGGALERGLGDSLADLGRFLGATRMTLPKAWRRIV